MRWSADVYEDVAEGRRAECAARIRRALGAEVLRALGTP
jgi:hypothetical protein